MLPQTWEDPNVTHEVTKCNGDNVTLVGNTTKMGKEGLTGHKKGKEG